MYSMCKIFTIKIVCGASFEKFSYVWGFLCAFEYTEPSPFWLLALGMVGFAELHEPSWLQSVSQH